MTTHLSIEEAKSLIDSAAGSREFTPTEHQEAWMLANLPYEAKNDPAEYLDIGIEKIDYPEEFEDLSEAIPFACDEEAWHHVQAKADQGSEMHRRAIRIHQAANSLRFHIWGEEWIDSRIGPSGN